MKSNQFGQLLWECRKKIAGLSQKELGDEIPLHESMISRFENETHTPTLEQLQVIINILARFGVPRKNLDQLRAAYPDQKLFNTPPMVNPAALMIDQFMEKLTSDEKIDFNSYVVDLINIYRELSRAKSENSERKWETARSRLKALEEPLNEYLQKLRLPFHKARGDSAYSQRAYLEAIRHYWQALQNAQQLKDSQDPVQGQIHLKLGDAHRRLAEWNQAKEHYEKAMEVFEEKDKFRYVDSLRKIGGVYLYQGQPTKAKYWCQKSLSISNDLGYTRGVYKALQHESWRLQLSYQWDEAVKIAKRALNLVEETEMDETNRQWELLKALIYLGDALRVQRTIGKAIDAYLEAERISKQLEEKKQDPKLLYGSIWSGLGKAYLKEGQILKAKQYVGKSLEYLLEQGAEDFRIAIDQNEQGNLLNQLGEYQQAEHYLNEASFHLNRVGNDFHYANSLVNLCQFYYNQERSSKIDEIVEKVKEIERRVEEGLIDLHLAEIQLILGKRYINENSYLNAAEAFCIASQKAAGCNERFFSETMDRIQGEINRLLRARQFDAVFTICETYETFWANKVRSSILFVQDALNTIKQQKEEILPFISSLTKGAL